MSKKESPNDYGKEYQEESFWQKIRSYALAAGKAVIEIAFVLYYCLQDSDTPPWAKAVIIGALGYFILPMDGIPDFTPVVGFSDDFGALASAMGIVAVHIKPVHRMNAKMKVEEWWGEEDSESTAQA